MRTSLHSIPYRYKLLSHMWQWSILCINTSMYITKVCPVHFPVSDPSYWELCHRGFAPNNNNNILKNRWRRRKKKKKEEEDWSVCLGLSTRHCHTWTNVCMLESCYDGTCFFFFIFCVSSLAYSPMNHIFIIVQSTIDYILQDWTLQNIQRLVFAGQNLLWKILGDVLAYTRIQWHSFQLFGCCCTFIRCYLLETWQQNVCFPTLIPWNSQWIYVCVYVYV